jgi:AcrR family transcriptional regulator
MAIDDTRDKILSVANTLFSKFGFHKTSMDEIARLARKAKGSLYYHFANKEKLFTEVVQNEMDLLKIKLLQIINNQDLTATEKLKKYLIMRMFELSKAVNYHEVLRADLFEHFDFLDNVRYEMDVWEKDKLKTLVLEGVKNKEFVSRNDIEILLDMFLMILKGLEVPFYIQNKYDNYAPHFDGLMGILTKGLSY